MKKNRETPQNLSGHEKPLDKWDFKNELNLRTGYYMALDNILGLFMSLEEWARHQGDAGMKVVSPFIHDQLPKRLEIINKFYHENAERLGISTDPPPIDQAGPYSLIIKELMDKTRAR